MNDGVYIVLGCFGRCDNDFVSCSGLRNKILFLKSSDLNFSDLMDYLDNMRLFDRVLLDYNAVRRLIFKVQNDFDLPTKKVWPEKMFMLYQKFVIDHKDCGLFIDLELNDESNQKTDAQTNS